MFNSIYIRERMGTATIETIHGPSLTKIIENGLKFLQDIEADANSALWKDRRDHRRLVEHGHRPVGAADLGPGQESLQRTAPDGELMPGIDDLVPVGGVLNAGSKAYECLGFTLRPQAQHPFTSGASFGYIVEFAEAGSP